MWGDAAKEIGYKDSKDLMDNFSKVGFQKLLDAFVKLDDTSSAETMDIVKNRM